MERVFDSMQRLIQRSMLYRHYKRKMMETLKKMMSRDMAGKLDRMNLEVAITVKEANGRDIAFIEPISLLSGRTNE